MAADRMRKVNELLLQNVSEVFSRELDLPEGVFVTVTSVDTSRDLKHAVVYLTVLPDGKRGSALEYIQRHAGEVQKMLGSRVQLKFTPRLRFELDQGAIKAQGVFDVMDVG
ncbi:30S ribosome-binding factor RbfA [Patescibacteria group bacterium]